MAEYLLQREQFIPAPLDEVFDFFSQAENLDRITPTWLKFNIVTPTPIQIEAGTIIDYRLRYRGFPMRWRTEIAEWVPGVRFVDQALVSPYKLWHHTHTFEARDGGTLVGDSVRYALPFGPLGRIAHVLSVRRDVNRIFDHRLKTMTQIFPGSDSQPTRDAMAATS
jgi:ligand-binding SRPBCC domain-containing protein